MADRVRHVLRIADEPRDRIERLCDAADALRADPAAAAARHGGRIVAMLFLEPSTRTRLSFESAALRLGARCIGFADPAASSTAKGETLIDTVRTVQRYADAIVLRHPAEGAALLASKVAAVPIINAGDGAHEHPTQTLTDLYTIRQRFGTIDGRTIGLAGDLRYGRTVHSLAQAAAEFGGHLVCIAPDEMQLPAHLLERLRERARVETCDDLPGAIGELDVLYMTRVQVERMDGRRGEGAEGRRGEGIALTADVLARAGPDLLLLHPLPRVDEIAAEVDEDPRAWYFEQAANGVLVRMALLDAVLSALPASPLGAAAAPLTASDPPWHAAPGESRRCVNERCVTQCERHVAQRLTDDGRCAYCDHEISAAPGR